MGDVADLLIAISTVLGSLASAVVLVWTTVRSGRRPEQVAKQAADETATAVVEALADGQLSKEEVEAIRDALQRRHEDGGGS